MGIYTLQIYLLELGAVCYLSHSRDVKHNRLKENILHSGGLWETFKPRRPLGKERDPQVTIAIECYQEYTLGS